MLASAAPPRRIALLQYTYGSVSIQPHGTGGWVAAAPNRQLTISDNVWTDKASRAELNVGTGMMQMNSETSLTIVNVDFRTVQVQVHQGTMYLHVRHLFGGEVYEVDSSNGAFVLAKAGDYRFDVDPKADTTTITVWKGEGSVTGDRRCECAATSSCGYRESWLLMNAIALLPPTASTSGAACRNQRLDSAFPGWYPPPGVIIYGRPRPWY